MAQQHVFQQPFQFEDYGYIASGVRDFPENYM